VTDPTRPTIDLESTVTDFLDFYRSRGHRLIPAAPLVTPPGDPVLFTTSGMHPLIGYLRGASHPSGSRLVDRQRCLRTTDLDEVGDSIHLTVFDMLGSWSLGDYDSQQSLRWGLELLLDTFGFAADRLYGTAFGGDREVPEDRDAVQVWQEFGLPVQLTGTENWWAHGPVGLCGPDSEAFVWTGDVPPTGTPTTDPRWVEVVNHVSLRYLRGPDGRLEPLPRPCVDTGMGLERLLMLRQGLDSVFETEPLRPWTDQIRSLWPVSEPCTRLLADHLRAGVLVAAEGVTPSASGRGYVLRRLLRRCLTVLWRQDPSWSLDQLPEHLFDPDSLDGPDGARQTAGTGRPSRQLRELVLAEQRRFGDQLRRGRPAVRRLLRQHGALTEQDLAFLHDTHGLPAELVELVQHLDRE